MHDIDLTKNHFGAGIDELETEDSDGLELEFGDESEMFGDSEQSPFSEVEEMEMAADLLEVATDEELDQFLGSLIKKAGKLAGGFIKSPAGKALGGILKGVAKKALPIAGGALGNLIVPGLGGVVGSHLASSAGKAFGLELEGMSPEDQEFEVARQYVKFAGTAAQKVAQMPSNTDSHRAVTTAVTEAARQHAPGLLKQRSNLQTRDRTNLKGKRSGRWIRQGNKIILFGV